jgi:hypothetical protein
MTLRTRLARLERAAPKPPEPAGPVTDEDWLAAFEDMGRQKMFAAEPDFPRALAEYRRVVTKHREKPEIPADFMPLVANPEERLRWWRAPLEANEVNEVFMWLAGMFERVSTGVPPVTEAEFAELASWFEANQDRLRALAGYSGLLDLGDGRRDSVPNLVYQVRKGPRDLSAGEVADTLRQLRERYSDSK